MPIINNIDYSLLSKATNHILNPNFQTGVLLEEIPSDIGRSYEGYKRGGILEGAEKMRKELMSAAVWLFGIPVFNKLGSLACEKILNIPFDIDISDPLKGNDSIKNSALFLTSQNKDAFKDIDVSELLKYKDKFLGQDVNTLSKKIKGAKIVTGLSAIVLNCIMMGLVIPKVNQKMTQNKMERDEAKRTAITPTSIDEFKMRTNSTPSFTGSFVNALGNVAFLAENSNRFRLLITDIPMIAGRCITSRNKYEALEYVVIDGLSAYFYNFFAEHIKKALSKITNIPLMNPKTVETLSNMDENTLKTVLENLKKGVHLDELLSNKDFSDTIYDIETFGKYNKINRFVKDKDIEFIDSSIFNFLSKVKDKIKQSDGTLNMQDFAKTASRYSKLNALLIGAGYLGAILGLAVFTPKLAFWITKKLTGKYEFTGIANFDDDKKNKKEALSA